MDDATRRPREAALMNHLSSICMDAEAAMAYMQDDGRITGTSDVRAIAALLRKIRMRTLDAEGLVGASGSYAMIDSDGVKEEKPGT